MLWCSAARKEVLSQPLNLVTDPEMTKEYTLNLLSPPPIMQGMFLNLKGAGLFEKVVNGSFLSKLACARSTTILPPKFLALFTLPQKPRMHGFDVAPARHSTDAVHDLGFRAHFRDGV